MDWEHMDWERLGWENVGCEAELVANLEQFDQRQDIPRDVKQELRRLTDSLRELSDWLLPMQRLEILGDVATGVAHELNNLLMGVVGNVDLALDEVPADAPAREPLAQILQAGQRAARLAKQLLAFAGKSPLIKVPLDLSRLLEDALPLLRAAVSRNTALELDLPDVPRIIGDPHQLTQATVNLLRIASEASAGGTGPVRVRTGHKQLDEASLSSPGLVGADRLRPGRHLFLEVRDPGSSAPVRGQRKVFDAHGASRACGRGLRFSATLEAVRAHAGAIEMESGPATGTTVRIWIPCEPWEEESLAAPRAILLVDDEPYVRNIGTHALTRAGYAVVSAVSGEQALARLKEHAEVVAVVLDATMPQMASEKVLGQIHRLQPELPVLLSSGYSEQQVTARFEGLSWTGFLQKPYRPKELVAAVEAMFE